MRPGLSPLRKENCMLQELFKSAAETYDFSKVKPAKPYDFSFPEPGPEADLIARALEAFSLIYIMATRDGQPEAEALRLGREIYVQYMPLLIDEKSIRDNIACVSQGLLHKVFDPKEANSLLYAAQVALSLLRKTRGRARKS
jgi:hypothetical protein